MAAMVMLPTTARYMTILKTKLKVGEAGRPKIRSPEREGKLSFNRSLRPALASILPLTTSWRNEKLAEPPKRVLLTENPERTIVTRMRGDEVGLHRSLFNDRIGVLFSASHVPRRGEELAENGRKEDDELEEERRK